MLNSDGKNTLSDLRQGNTLAPGNFRLWGKDADSDVYCYLRWWTSMVLSGGFNGNWWLLDQLYAYSAFIEVYGFPVKKEKIFFKSNQKVKLSLLKEHVISTLLKTDRWKSVVLAYLDKQANFNRHGYSLKWYARQKHVRKSIRRDARAQIYFPVWVSWEAIREMRNEDPLQ